MGAESNKQTQLFKSLCRFLAQLDLSDASVIGDLDLTGLDSLLLPFPQVQAFCVFDGTAATPAPATGSYNVASITDNGAGDYTINFTDDLEDANYGVFLGGRGASGEDAIITENMDNAAKTVSACRILATVGSTDTDLPVVSFMAVR